MDTPKTQKEMILMMSVQMDALTASNLELSKKQLQMSLDWSIYMNKSELKISKILGYLESDPTTNHKGVVEQQHINTNNINDILSKWKIGEAKWGILGFAGGSGVVGLIYKLFF
jgi:hypothetical protein